MYAFALLCISLNQNICLSGDEILLKFFHKLQQIRLKNRDILRPTQCARCSTLVLLLCEDTWILYGAWYKETHTHTQTIGDNNLCEFIRRYLSQVSTHKNIKFNG